MAEKPSKSSFIKKIALNARLAATEIAVFDSEAKNAALEKIASELIKRRAEILEENSKDLADAEKNKTGGALAERLMIDNRRVEEMSEGIAEVARLEDPVGQVVPFMKRPNGLVVEKMRIPLGVIGMVYESRPNVTADSAALCLKSGNSVILRGGSESLRSNIAIGKIISDCLSACGINPSAVSVVPDADRKHVLEMLKLDGLIDLIIPRGGEALIRFVAENSSIPVLKHYKGICHIFVDESAKTDMAVDICVNSKVQRPGVCNAMETMLVHEKAAANFLPVVAEKMTKNDVTMKGCPKTAALVANCKKATEKDWETEHLGLVLGIRVVKDIEEAMDHISKYGSMHTDSIITENTENARRFLRGVESSAVMHNASTRFNDGGELGMGAEIGISTTKIHAFGPMGLKELTSEKFVVRGNGQTRN
ncbi:MAG: glutamate-5-semialdehyde dehydrogenase [Candidatus Mycalebacterium zealandia]|nr:MAG: glutamate-5-semialdehyde dehydrogenase [Candidatus Mycalebacterium zealandia]